MASKEELKKQIKLRDEVISKQLDTIDVLQRIIDKIYPKQSESFQDKTDKDISHPLPYKRTKDINPEALAKCLTTVPSDLLKNNPHITVGNIGKDINPDIFKNCQFMDRIIIPEQQDEFDAFLTMNRMTDNGR